MGGEAITPHITGLLEISLNNATIPSNREKATVVPIYKGDVRSAVSKYRTISLTSVVCEQLENVIASCLRQVWDKNDWLYEGKHEFGPGYSCENQVNTECQNIAESLYEGVGINYNRHLQVLYLVPHDRMFTKMVASGLDSRVAVWVREFLVG